MDVRSIYSIAIQSQQAFAVGNRNIVVIGGSAGAMHALSILLQDLPNTVPASFFVVLHLQPTDGWLLERIATLTSMTTVSPEVRPEQIRDRHVYLARPDHHLLIKDGHVLASRGPRENMWRPAIDVLFRSAAVAHTSQVIGVLLSGELDDGTAGLQAIKTCGGTAIVQDPADAMYPDMPTTAKVNVQVDHCIRMEQMAALLRKLVNEPAGPAPPVQEGLKREVRIAEGREDYVGLSSDRGELTELNCPECGGPLWQRGADQTQFRCLVGHSYRLNSLLHGTDLELERTLWAAIRLFEQRANIARTMAFQEREKGRENRAHIYMTRAAESQRYAATMKELRAQRVGAIEAPNEQDHTVNAAAGKK